MPWIEPQSGDVGHGVGGGKASLNNVAFGTGGVAGWRDPDNLAFANGDDGWLVSIHNKVTGANSRVVFEPDTGPVEVPANSAFAGGGHVVAWLAGESAQKGLHTTLLGWPRVKQGRAYQLPNAGLMGMGPDAAVGFKPDNQSDGPTLIRESNGDEWQLTSGAASFLTMYGARQNMWQENFVVKVTNLPQPQVFYDNGGGVWGPSAAFAADAWWIAYYSSVKGIILHPFASCKLVFSILPKGDGWHRISSRGGNILRIAISRTEGEGPGDIWGYDIDVTNGHATPLPCWPGGKLTVFPFMPIEDVNPPAAVVIPTFSFNHPVSTAVFKDPNGDTAAPAEILVNQNTQLKARPVFVAADTISERSWRGQLEGIYTEATGPTLAEVIAQATAMKTRVLVCHDSKDPWTLPKGLRPWDVCAIETYRYASETLDAALSRWQRDVLAMLGAWPNVCAIVPMYYCMGGTIGSEVWPVADVLDTQRHLNELVNLSPRIKIVAPFSYLRANGIVAHPELQQSYANLLAAASNPLDLMPVDSQPQPPTSAYYRAKEYSIMSTEIGAIKGPGNKFGRVLEADKGQGMWGWYPIRFDRDEPDDDCWFELSQPDSRHQLRHTKVDGILGADATEHSTDILHQFYLKPGSDRGILESPVLIVDPASPLVVGYLTWPEKGVSGPAFTWVKKS